MGNGDSGKPMLFKSRIQVILSLEPLWHQTVKKSHHSELGNHYSNESLNIYEQNVCYIVYNTLHQSKINSNHVSETEKEPEILLVLFIIKWKLAIFHSFI